MSLDIEFHSAIFSIYHISGLLLGGISFLILVIAWNYKIGKPETEISKLSYDLGRFLLAFSMIWFYIWFCQFLIVWYGNIPEEMDYYLSVTEGGLKYLFIINIVLNFVLPFILLLGKRVKQNIKLLSLIAVFVLTGRWTDYYLSIMPFNIKKTITFGFFEVGIFLIFGTLFLLILKLKFKQLNT